MSVNGRSKDQTPEQRDLYQGFGDALAQAFEFVATPALFAFLGFLLDRWLGTVAVFAVAFGGFVLGYEVWKFWTVYQRRMEAEEAARAARARGTS